VIALLGAMAVWITGCKRPDADVSRSPYYNFSSFTNTAWKPKVKIALVDIEQYTGRHAPTLVGPKAFDPTQPNYYPSPHMSKILEVLPPGTRIRIARLMQDRGAWGGVRVTGILDDGREVVVDRMLLAKNLFLYDKATSPSTNWGVNPDLLEAAGDGAPHR
jgi:hypothetical protein